jgi:hypothetical protein
MRALSVLPLVVLLWAVDARSYDQEAKQPPPGKPAGTPGIAATAGRLDLRAALVLTPEFCATKSKKGDLFSGKETFEIGKAACAELESALSGTFSKLTRVEAEPTSGDAQIVLTPRFVDVGKPVATLTVSSNRPLVVLLQWTAKDASGKTVWIETVAGSSKNHNGNVFTQSKKNLKSIVEDSVKDMAQESAAKMKAAPELRGLTQ